MASDDDPADQRGEPERLDTAPTPGPPSKARAIVLGGAVLTAGVLVGVTALSGVFGQSAPAPSTAATTPTASASRPVTFPTPVQPTPRPSTPPVFSSSGFLANLDLVVYARSNRAVYRIDTRKGRVTRTATENWPDVSSFVALPGWLIMVPDAAGVPYEVVDDRAPRELDGRWTEGTEYFPGPDGRVWMLVETVARGRSRALLLDSSGTQVHQRVSAPENGVFTSDGAGGLLWTGIGGTYRAGPDGLRRVTTGQFLGANRTGYVVTECSVRLVCATYAYDRSGENRRKVGPAIEGYGIGALSSDGKLLTVQRWNDPGPTLAVVDVATGRDVEAFEVEQEEEGSSDPSPYWLPDGRLLVLDGTRLRVYDPRTKENERIRLRLPPLRQLAVHSAG